MTPHPRLLASPAELERLRKAPTLPLLKKASGIVAAAAKRYAGSSALIYNPNVHNALLNRAREMQGRILTLLVRWMQTGGESFRLAALNDVWTLGEWEHWSSDALRDRNPDPDAYFDLSCGENSATLALAYDWLYATLSPGERDRFRQIALRRTLHPFLTCTEKGNHAGWWFGIPHSNWNTVCAGGAGMVALAFHEALPEEAAEVLRRAGESIAPYMESLEATAGGWEEGIGYWNYGHRYAFWFLLSHERATRKQHPLLGLEGARRTLDFPLDFCPHGRPCSFADVNSWGPLPFHYAAAARLKRADLIKTLDGLLHLADRKEEIGWPVAAELMVFHPRKVVAGTSHSQRSKSMVGKLYPKLDWGILADRMPDPSLYLSVRGGRQGPDVPHGVLNLLSFHCVVGTERLIDSIGIEGGNDYLETTFSDRRRDLPEAGPFTKNTLFLNGVGINDPGQAATMALAGRGWKGFRLDVTGSIYWYEAATVKFCARLFLMMEGPFALIVDRADLSATGRMEARFHTFSKVHFKGDQAEIAGRKERLTVACAATVPSGLYSAEDALTTHPDKRSTMLRWCTKTRENRDITFVTLLAPGAGRASVAIEEAGGSLLVKTLCKGKRHVFKIAKDLKKVSVFPGRQ